MREMRAAVRARSLASGAAIGALAGIAWAHQYGEPGPITTTLLALCHALLGAIAAELARVSSRDARGAAPLAAWAACAGWPAVAGVVLAPASVLGRAAVLPALAVGSALAVASIALLARRKPGLWLLALAPLAVLAPVSWEGAHTSPTVLPSIDVAGGGPLRRVAVLGIDGGDWQVVDPMLEAGELPALRALVDAGVSGTLMSADPMFSPVVWTSIFTGASPRAHGLAGWHSSLATNLRVPTLWGLLASRSARSVVANVPGTWPPRIELGAMVAGFPLPQLVTSADARGGQFVGVVVSASAREGRVPTIALEGGAARVPLGRARLAARTRAQNAFIEEALRKRWLGGEMAWLALDVEDGDRVRVDGVALDLPVGEWTPWIDVQLAGDPAFLRVRRLARERFYVTPPFASPGLARHPMLAGDAQLDAIAPDHRYVVEGAGWKATADADLRDPLFEHLTQVHALQSRALAALARTDWQLLAGVYTLTDRVQHAFWPFHDPAGFDPPPAPSEVAAHGDKVKEAYRRVDREIGRLRALLPPDTTLFVVSDHGSAADREAGFGGHRAEGLFIAAGPGIVKGTERTTLSIYDLTPTLLAGLGWPVADDLAGTARVDLLAGEVAAAHVPSYHGPSQEDGAGPDEIEGSTEEQLRALGYVD